MAFHPPITVAQVLQEISSGKYRIPSFSRGFRWGQMEVESFFDRILENPLIGCILLDSSTTSGYDFQQTIKVGKKQAQTKTTLNDKLFVVDGVQRISALYVGLMGGFIAQKNITKTLCFLLDAKAPARFRLLSNVELASSSKTWLKVPDALNMGYSELAYYLIKHGAINDGKIVDDAFRLRALIHDEKKYHPFMWMLGEHGKTLAYCLMSWIRL